jgi:hypothetical protein
MCKTAKFPAICTGVPTRYALKPKTFLNATVFFRMFTGYEPRIYRTRAWKEYITGVNDSLMVRITREIYRAVQDEPL